LKWISLITPSATACIGPGTLCTQGLARTLTGSVIFRLFQQRSICADIAVVLLLSPLQTLVLAQCMGLIDTDSNFQNRFVASIVIFVANIPNLVQNILSSYSQVSTEPSFMISCPLGDLMVMRRTKMIPAHSFAINLPLRMPPENLVLGMSRSL